MIKLIKTYSTENMVIVCVLFKSVDLIPKISMYKIFPRMYGLFQTSFYFGYMAVFSTALGIMCGEYKKTK